MMLIADSGSTKTLWCMADGGVELSRMETAGLNPYYHDAESIDRVVTDVAAAFHAANAVGCVAFYGAGCTGGDKNEMIYSALCSHFLSAQIEVCSDMLGAARALLQRTRGVACILGTGSNSCLYDGQSIADNVPAGGYVLGDEGSGAYLGKRLVSEYIKRRMPDEVAALFERECRASVSDIIENVYRRPFPNRYLANYAKFIAAHAGSEPWLYALVLDSFTEFLRHNVCAYPGWETMPVGFVGSVAWHFRDILRDAAAGCGVTVGDVMQNPIEGLLRYYKPKTVIRTF